MSFAALNQELNARAGVAQRALQEARTLLPQVATSDSRTFSITNGGIDVPGTAERFVTGVASGAVGPAIRDAGLNAISAGAIAGGLQGALEGGLRGAIEGGISGALNNAIATSGIGDALNNAAAQLGVALPQVPGLPAFGGSISGASGGAAASARPSTTRAGTQASSNTLAATTEIRDATSTGVEITVDSFLQGLQGSLSSIAGAGGIGGILGGALQNLLSSTGLTGALGGLVSGLSQGLSNALGGLTQALGNAATGLMQGLGDAISSIPGVGPVLSNMSSAIGSFAGNLSGAYNNLSPALQAGVNGAVAAVGANVVNRLDIPGLPRINPAIAGVATAAISFSDNPAAQLNNIANAARNVDRATYKETRDPTFVNVASAASRAAKEMEQNIQRDPAGGYQLIRDKDDATADVNETLVIKNGELTATTNTFVDNLNDIQLQSYQTYERILRSRFASYGSSAPDLAVQAYNEYIEFDALKTPETKLFILQVEIKDADLIENLADRFLLFYRSSKSRYTMDGL